MIAKQAQIPQQLAIVKQPAVAKFSVGGEFNRPPSLPQPKETTAPKEDIAALKKKIAELEKKLANPPASTTATIEKNLLNQITAKYDAYQKELLYAFQDQYEQLEAKLKAAKPNDRDQIALDKAKVEERYERDAINLQNRKIQELYIAEGTLTPEAQEALEQGLPGAEQEVLRQLEEKGLPRQEPTQEPTPTPSTGPTTGEPTTIHRLTYPRWWRSGRVAGFNCTPAAAIEVVPAPTRGRLFIGSLVITGSGASPITITFGTAGTTGTLYIDSSTYQMPLIFNFGEAPAPCGTGALTIVFGDPVGEMKRIAGFAVYYVEPEP